VDKLSPLISICQRKPAYASAKWRVLLLTIVLIHLSRTDVYKYTRYIPCRLSKNLTISTHFTYCRTRNRAFIELLVLSFHLRQYYNLRCLEKTTGCLHSMLLSRYIIQFEKKIFFYIYKSVNIIVTRLLLDVVVVVHVQVQVHPQGVWHVSWPATRSEIPIANMKTHNKSCQIFCFLKRKMI